MFNLKEIMDAVNHAAAHGNPVSRIKMRGKDWRDAVDELNKGAVGEPLLLPPSQHPRGDDVNDCVGLICGVPVLVDDTLDLDTKFVTEYDAR